MYFFYAKFPERCGYFELKRNKCDVPVMPMMCLCKLGFMVQCFLVESKSLLLKYGAFFVLLFFLSARYTQEKFNHGNKY